MSLALATAGVLTIITFVGTNIRSPRDAAVAALGHEASPVQIQAYIEANNLDGPLWDRYLDWLGQLFAGDLGVSTVSGLSVGELVGGRIGPTATLAAVSLVVSLLIAIPIGMFMAHRVGSNSDTALLTGSVVLAALPPFVVGILLIFIFSATLGWLPPNSSGLLFAGESSSLRSYILPVLTLCAAVIPYVTRMTRAGMRDALSSLAVRSALLRGLPRGQVQLSYALRLAALPILGATSISIAYLLGSVLVVEQVFGFPGLGQLTVGAISQGDIPVVQGCALVLGLMIIVSNLATDIAALRFNPRLREG